MRGNELSWIFSCFFWRSCRFPIPMRGNETLMSADRHGGTIGFPIPMRGNEDDSNAAGATIAELFPIHMRGNESAACMTP